MQIKVLFKRFEALGRPFLFIWLGSVISMVGTLIVSFALSVWLFQKTGSVLDFSGMMVAAALPGILVLPFAGSFADRFDRRHVMIASDSVAAIMSFILFFLIWSERMEVWHLYVFNFVVSMAGAFQFPAFTAALSGVLPKDQMARAQGVMGVSGSLLSIFSPMLAGLLLGIIGLSGIVLLDLVTFCIGTVLILKAFVHIPPAIVSSEKSLIQDALKDFYNAMSYFKKQRLMLGLLTYVAFQDSLLAFVSSMITPLVLSNYSSIELGKIMIFAGLGSLAGSGLLMIKGNPKRLMITFLICNVILSFSIMIAGGCSSVSLYSACAFVALFAGSAGDGCSGALWMRKVPLDRQGRIFALIGMIMTISVPIVAVLGGFVADQIFEPALAPGGVWAESIGVWLGTGKGRGLGLIFIICGLLGVVISLAALLQKQLRRVDILVPDGH